MNVIMISENEEECENIKRILNSNFSKLVFTGFSSGLKAIEEVSNFPRLQFIILDLNIRNEPVGEIFERMSEVNKSRPVILIGGNNWTANLVPEDFYSRNFANEVLERPLDLIKFKDVVKGAMQWTEEQIFHENTFEGDPNDYIPVKINYFYRFRKMSYDVYLELASPKFVRIIYANEPFSQSLIIRYAKKNVKHLFLGKNDHLNFLETSLDLFLQTFKDANLSSQSPSARVLVEQVHACALLHDYLKTVGIGPNLLNFVEKLVEFICQTFLHYKNFKDLLNDFPFGEKDIAARSILTAYLCQGLLKKLGWDSSLTRGKLVFTSLLHDCFVEKEEHLKMLFKQDVFSGGLSEKEQQEFLEHPAKAAELASFFGKFPETSYIISQHHEMPMGRGFPEELSSLQLTSASCLFIVANNFSNQIYEKEYDLKAVLRTLKEFIPVFNEGNFKSSMWALANLLK